MTTNVVFYTLNCVTMKQTLAFAIAGFTILAASNCMAQEKKKSKDPAYMEQYRPQVHFSPKQKWMNDPNGMVFYKGVYHLFFQYYPDATVWGPMHWGHATSKDMIHWDEQPIALYPDSLGYIFSGSAVVDVNNTSGFGKNGEPPLVAIFTHHDPKAQRAKTNTYQNQSIAYSLDNGKTWTKYAGNPVLKNPGITDFRDPKVGWYEAGKKWIMTLATKDRVTFFSSPDLKNWTKESEFGNSIGAHGGVWECPDLFPLEFEGKKMWVLLVSINPGGPNGGSATQYFIGDFDGKTFTPLATDTRWIDYGTDDYAGVTWSNTGNRKVFLGWMSNWKYARTVPTKSWRSAMTLPRELKIKKEGDKYLLASYPVTELRSIEGSKKSLADVNVKDYNLSGKIGSLTGPAKISLSADQLADLSIVISNEKGEQVIIGYDKAANNFFIDRTKSGKTDFDDKFPAKHIAPRLSTSSKMELTLVLDDASVELFADGGLTTMTDIFFPNSAMKDVRLQSPGNYTIKKIEYATLKSIW